MAKQFEIRIRPTIKQAKCWKKLQDDTTKFILFGGGAGGGKSWIGCEWIVTMCLQYPGVKFFIGRNELKRLMQSTFITFLKMCKFHNIPRSCWKLNGQLNYIEFYNGSRIDLLDVMYKPSDPLYERFGSIEYTSGWLEEVGEIPEKAFEMLKSRIGRHMNKEYGIMSKIFKTCNPKKNWVYVSYYKPWKEGTLPDNACFIQSLYNDNPYTAKQYEDNLKSIKDPVLRARLKDGLWEYSDDDSTLMDYNKIVDIFTNEFVAETNGEFFLSVDVARFGRDKAVIILWQGYYIRKIWYYDKSSSTFLEEKIRSKCKQYYIPLSNVVVDQDGVGGGLVDNLYGCIGFCNASRAIEELYEDTQETQKYSYKNLRAQCYFKLAEAVNEGKIGCAEIDADIRNWVIEELECIRSKDVSNNEKKFQIISKDDIQDIIGRSPDFADAFMMRMVFDLGQRAVEIALVF